MRKLCTPGENIFSLGYQRGWGNIYCIHHFTLNFIFFTNTENTIKYITYSKNNEKLKKHI